MKNLIMLKSKDSMNGNNSDIWALIRNNISYLSLIILIIIFRIWAGPNFLSLKNWSYIAQQVPVLAVLSMAETFAITGGFIDLSVGSVLGMVAYVAAFSIQKFGPIGLISGLLVGTLIGLLNGAIFSYLRIPSFITTLATQVILRASLYLISGGSAVYIAEGLVTKGFSAEWLTNMGRFPYVFIIAFVVAIICYVIYNHSVFGWNLKAIGGNETVVKLFGVNLSLFKLRTFGIVGFFVGIAGLLNLARVGAATPVSGQGMELDAISAVVLGGIPLTGGYGSIVKTFIGSVSLVVLANGLTLAGVPPSWNNVARGLLLIVAVAIALDRKKIGVVK